LNHTLFVGLLFRYATDKRVTQSINLLIVLSVESTVPLYSSRIARGKSFNFIVVIKQD